MKLRSFALSVLFYASAAPSTAQITITPPPEVSAVMATCAPTDAQPEAVVADLRGRGWSEPDPSRLRAALTALTAAHLWSFLPDQTAEERIRLLAQLTDAVEQTLGENGVFLTLGDDMALILWREENLSCLWAGPQTVTLDTLAIQLGGPLPNSTGPSTRTLIQRVEAGGQIWRRQMAVGRTLVDELPPEVSEAEITDAARLDRSPG